MDVSLELYKTFYYVAKHLSFKKASEKLFISSSAVSQAINKLEEKLDTTLFIRNTKKVNLTIDGKILFENIEQAFLLIEQAEYNFVKRQNLYEGELFIACTDTLCKYHLLKTIKSVQESYPKIKINIINDTSPRCFELLKKGSVDFIVVNIWEGLIDEKFIIEKQVEFFDIFVASEKHYDLLPKDCTLEDLAEFPLLVLDKKTVTRKYFDILFEMKGLKINPEIEVQSVDLIIEMVKAGLGIGFLPEFCFEKSLYKINLNESMIKRKYRLISHSKMPLKPINKIFIEVF